MENLTSTTSLVLIKIDGRESWSKDEEHYLEEYYQTKDIALIMKYLQRSYFSVKRKAQAIGLDRDIYDGGYYFSTGDVMETLGLAKSTVLYYVKMGYLKCNTLKSFNKYYKKFTVEHIVDFMYKYPSKWVHRKYDVENLQMLFLGYNGAKEKVERVKEYISAPPSFWREKVRAHSKTLDVPTMDEKLEAL